MTKLKVPAIALLMSVCATVAMAQSTANTPGRADTTDPNSAPRMGNQGATPYRGPLDAAGRANTADPNSTNSAATNGAGTRVNPYTAKENGKNIRR